MKNLIEFLEKLNKLTQETGVVINTFGDSFYDPKIMAHDSSEYDQDADRIYISYDGDTYVGRIGEPYRGTVVFPKDYDDDMNN